MLAHATLTTSVNEMKKKTFFLSDSFSTKVPRLEVTSVNCMCHVLTKEKGDLAKFTESSWETLWNAADVRRYDVWRNLQPYQVDEPMGSYHRRCYQAYTHRKTLQRIASRHLGASQDPDASKSSDSENNDTRDDEEISRACSRKTRNKVVKTNMAACLFCGQFWDSYLEMVSTLLHFVRATREGNWPLHINSVWSMLPWFFAYDRVNYSRYLTAYWWEMIRLPFTHPAAHEQLVHGEFGVQRYRSSSFAQVAVDQCIEQTINRDTKTSGGIVGFSLKPGAVQRWIVTAHERASVAGACAQLSEAKSSQHTDLQEATVHRHKESSTSTIQRDETDVLKLINVVESWTNPFIDSHQNVIVSLASGMVATSDPQQDLLCARDKGRLALDNFLEERLESSNVSFFAVLPRLKLKEFLCITVAPIKAGSKDIS